MVVEDDVACVMGTKIVTDYEGVTMSHFVQATPSMLKKMVAVSQVRILGFINTHIQNKVETKSSVF